MRFSATGLWSASLVALALTQTPAAGGTQEPSLATVLTQATDYVDRLHRELTGVVMEERYEQRAREPSSNDRQMRRLPGIHLGPVRERRVTLLSDYLLVQPQGSESHYGFRDVFAVNGRAVRDRQERLTELFLNRSASVDRRIDGIVADSARHNIGDIDRNINTPTMALLFLSTEYKHRFEFRRGTDTTTSLRIDEPARGFGLWVVDYEETGPTAVIRGRDDQRLPVRGRYWIEPATGRVFLSELVLDADSIEALITVRYEANDTLGHFVPVEMRERYRNLLSGSRVEGTATYTRIRRFQVLVEESAPFRN